MDYQDNLPLSEAVFFILLSLLPGPKHGYTVMKDVQTLSDSRANLSTGTLYGALKRLLDEGWVRRFVEFACSCNSRLKRFLLMGAF